MSIPKGNRVDNAIGNNVVDCVDELELSRNWETESNLGSVKGRLRDSVEYWSQVLEAPKTVIDVIRHGYILPLMTKPDAFIANNHQSTQVNKKFVDGAIKELLANGCIRMVSYAPHVCSPLLVVESSSGKKRLVINLKYLNLYLWKDKFKYEGIQTALDYFQEGDYMFTFDFKSGYHHVDIHESSQELLGFCWGDRHYVFTVLPFGLSTACYIFTKLLRPIVKLVRSKGIRMVVYLDDGIVVVSGLNKAKEVSLWVKSMLEKAGFVLNMEKSKLMPAKLGSWLGFEIDLEEGKICIPKRKIEKLKEQLEVAISKNYLDAKSIASIVGRIISMSIAVGSITRLRTRSMYSIIQSRKSWQDRLWLDDNAKGELVFWHSSLEQFNGQPLWRSPSAIRIVYSDASDTGFGGYSVEHGKHIVHGQWTYTEGKRSSTWRELRAVAEMLDTIIHKMAGHRIRWFTDNQNVVRIIQIGSRKEELQMEAMRIFKLAMQYSVSIEPEWIPRQEQHCRLL